jgi:hypothetical protein
MATMIIGKLDLLLREEYTNKFQELVRRLRIYQRQAYRILLINHSTVLLPSEVYNIQKNVINCNTLVSVNDFIIKHGLNKYDIIYVNQSNLFTDLNNAVFWVKYGYHVLLG